MKDLLLTMKGSLINKSSPGPIRAGLHWRISLWDSHHAFKPTFSPRAGLLQGLPWLTGCRALCNTVTKNKEQSVHLPGQSLSSPAKAETISSSEAEEDSLMVWSWFSIAGLQTTTNLATQNSAPLFAQFCRSLCYCLLCLGSCKAECQGVEDFWHKDSHYSKEQAHI